VTITAVEQKGQYMSGQWKNAPLAYVVGMVRFARMDLTSELINKIHTRIRSTFPQIDEHSQEVQEVSFSSQEDNPSAKKVTIEEWSMLNPTSTTGVLIRSDSMFLHTTNYENHEKFEQEMALVLEALNAESPIEYIQSIGLRSIDIIQETDKLKLDDCVPSQLKPLKIADNDEVQNTIIQMEVASQADNVVMKCLCVHLAALPQEIAPVDLIPLRRLLKADAMQYSNAPAIVLDIDCIYYQAQTMIPFQLDNVINTIEQQLHTKASKAFTMATTDKAREVWKNGNCS